MIYIYIYILPLIYKLCLCFRWLFGGKLSSSSAGHWTVSGPLLLLHSSRGINTTTLFVSQGPLEPVSSSCRRNTWVLTSTPSLWLWPPCSHQLHLTTNLELFTLVLTDRAAVGKQAFWGQRPSVEGAAITLYRFLQLADAYGWYLLEYFNSIEKPCSLCFSAKCIVCIFLKNSFIVTPPSPWLLGLKRQKPMTSSESLFLQSVKSCKNLSGSPLLQLQALKGGVVQRFGYVIMWLNVVSSGKCIHIPY